MIAGLKWRWMHLRRTFRDRARFTPALGWPAYLTLSLPPLFGPLAKSPLRRIRLRGFDYPFYYREGTSDPQVILQVFANGEYDCVAREPGVRFLVDCGANIGSASFYLLHKYPNARAVVVEPDAGNMAVCKKNLAPFRDRVQFVQAGVWSESAPMVVERGTYRDGEAWSFQVRIAKPGERPDFRAVTIVDLLEASGFPQIDLLKVDIEAAEAEVFRTGTDAWLAKVRTLAIELHGPECEAAVAKAFEPFRCSSVRNDGELTIYRDIQSWT